LCFLGIDVIVLTSRGNPVGVLHSLDNSSHVMTRVCQYETLKQVRAFDIAKQFVLSKIRSQDEVLKKYGLIRHGYDYIEAIKNLEANTLSMLQNRLCNIEGNCTKRYFHQLFDILPEPLRPAKRMPFKAYDRTNNLFNLGYTVLSWKVHVALIGAKLDHT
jgi:CRISPR-associated endonuclease Cas1